MQLGTRHTRVLRWHRGLLAGSAALGLLIGGAVQASAADSKGAKAPKVEERTPVYACKTTGFWELPGTDICFKVGGYAKANFIVQEDDANGGNAFSPTGITTRGPGGVVRGALADDGLSFHAQETRINFDARSFTEYGTVRAFIEFDFFTNNGNVAGQRVSNPNAPRMRHAYVQVGNLLAGQFWTAYTFFPVYFEAGNFAAAPATTFLRQGQLRWTQQFGNGFTVIVSLENPESAAGDLPPRGGTVGLVKNANNEILPDGVLVFQVNQSWGMVQVGGVVTQNEFTNTFTGADEDEVGFAAHIGAKINLPFGNGKSYLAGEGQYSDGANRYIFGANQGIGSAFFTPAGGSDTIEAYAVIVGGQFWVTDTVRFNAYFQYTDYDDIFPRVATAAALAEETWSVLANVAWSPVPRLDIILEGMYGERTDQDGGDGEAFWFNVAFKRSF